MNSDFVEISEMIPDIQKDVRYYSDYNFVGSAIDGYKTNKIYMTYEAAKALSDAEKEFRELGYRIIIYDAYRPLKAVKHFVRWANDIYDVKMKDIFYPDVNKKDLFELGYIAEYSSHCKGSTVDISLTDMNHKEIDMGGYFDLFSEVSGSNYSKTLTEEQINNRKLLKEIMCKHGFKTIESEWWHFTLIDEPYPETMFDFDIE